MSGCTKRLRIVDFTIRVRSKFYYLAKALKCSAILQKVGFKLFKKFKNYGENFRKDANLSRRIFIFLDDVGKIRFILYTHRGYKGYKREKFSRILSKSLCKIAEFKTF